MRSFGALSWIVRESLKEKGIGLVALLLMVSLPIFLLAPGLSLPGLILITIASYWLWKLSRRLVARLATRALAGGFTSRAKRLYWLLYLSSVGASARASCYLSLAACAASAQRYDLAQVRLDKLGAQEGALLAVSLNLQAYCRARLGQNLEEALSDSNHAVELRASVLGFRHTRGLLLLKLGRLSEATRDLQASWQDGSGSALFEAERCYDLGRLWEVRGQEEYGYDYFQRSLKASPGSHWARLSEDEIAKARPSTTSLEFGNTLDEFLL